MRTFVAAALVVTIASAVVAAGYKNLTSRDAKTLMEKNLKIFLLDVRTPEEYRQGRLKGSVLIPVAEVERRIAEIPKNRPVVVYCAVGSRSSAAAGFLASKGYSEVYNMSDGIIGWYRNGLPVEK